MESEGLKVFLRSTGDAIYSLNTVCVGLDAVSRGSVTKPADLTISWSTSDPKRTAMTARRFALRSALVFVEEALLEYLKYLSACPGQSSAVISAVKIQKAAKKVELLSAKIESMEEYYVPIVILLIRWRNQVVHNSKTSLAPHLREILIQSSGIIRKRHAGIDILQTLKNLDSRRITLKDFTTMIAVTIRYVRHVDSILSPQIDSSEAFQTHIVSRGLALDYKQVVGVNGEEKQRKKFGAFVISNFPSLTREQSNMLFKKRCSIRDNI